MPYDREQTCEKDPAGGITVHPHLSPNELRFGDKKESSPFDDDNSAQPKRNPVSYGGAKPRSECAGGNHSPKIQLPLSGEECCWRNNNFARHRKNRAFHRHQKNDAEIAPLQNPIEPDLK